MAPEILINRVQNDQRTKVDVYSFGIILHELFFEEQPYRTNEEQFDSIIALGNRVVGGLRPAVPEYLIDGISAAEEQYLMLMKQCWDGNPEQRPSFDDILSKLLNIEQMM
jgi:serine/threonine protein kinase